MKLGRTVWSGVSVELGDAGNGISIGQMIEGYYLVVGDELFGIEFASLENIIEF